MAVVTMFPVEPVALGRLARRRIVRAQHFTVAECRRQLKRRDLSRIERAVLWQRMRELEAEET